MSRRSGNLVQSGKWGGFPGVGWVISAALDDCDERLSFPVACRGRMGRGASLSTWRWVVVAGYWYRGMHQSRVEILIQWNVLLQGWDIDTEECIVARLRYRYRGMYRCRVEISIHWQYIGIAQHYQYRRIHRRANTLTHFHSVRQYSVPGKGEREGEKRASQLWVLSPSQISSALKSENTISK